MSARVVYLHDDPHYQPDEWDVKFTLTYEGPLRGASRDNKRAKHKHEIRKKFHPQLKHLWATTPSLFERREYPHMRSTPPQLPRPGEHVGIPWVEHIAQQYSRNGYKFVPLVIEELSLSCRIDILFLRWDQAGSLIRSGDLDNRLKTLFDALRLPDNQAELGGYLSPAEDEEPFFVLLQDDKLITHISVETECYAHADKRRLR
jgi:hypothetical protein